MRGATRSLAGDRRTVKGIQMQARESLAPLEPLLERSPSARVLLSEFDKAVPAVQVEILEVLGHIETTDHRVRELLAGQLRSGNARLVGW